MKRELNSLANREYDLVIVGGGIFGICAAWDASLRGLSVALLERRDFSHAASGNCFKVVHGGIRYLQHGDIYRVRESSRERSAFLRIAPHLVEPLPFVIPTYGHGMKGKEILRAALYAYDIITYDRNRDIPDHTRHIPTGHALSRPECIKLFPGLNRKGLTGGAVFSDAQMYSPARLAISFLKSAVERGTDAVNYAEVKGFLKKDRSVYGVKVKDMVSGQTFDVRGKVVLNASGGWAEPLLKASMDFSLNPSLSFSRDAAFVINRRITGDYALAVQAESKDPDAILSRGGRHLFLVPWRNHTLVGVWHVVHKGNPDKAVVRTDDLRGFIDEVNAAYPPLELSLNDVSIANAGLVLFGDTRTGTSDLSYGKRSVLVDHTDSDRISGLVTLVGVRYTTARGVAERTIDLIYKKLGRGKVPSRTAYTPIHGGDIENTGRLQIEAEERYSGMMNHKVISPLLRNHGSAYQEIVEYVKTDKSMNETFGSSNVIKAEAVHAVREEMAQKLSDVVLRRTDLGSGGSPGEEAIISCGKIVASELGWDSTRLNQEIEELNACFPSSI